MIAEDSKEFAQYCRDVLCGKRKVVVWGGNSGATVHEWQRQVQPLFMVDSQWNWWRNVKFLDLDIRSPIEIEGLKPEKTVVINNYYFAHTIGNRMEEFLQRLGGHPLVPPMHLHKMARLSAAIGGIDIVDSPMDSTFSKYVDDVLDEILTAPRDLLSRKALPTRKMLESFFASYSPHAYLFHALHNMRKEAMARFKPRKGRVALVIGSIDYGGAERQICNLAVGLKRIGWDPILYYLVPTVGGERYRDMLRENQVPFELVHQIDMRVPDLNAPDLYDLTSEQQRVLWYLEGHAALTVIGLYKKFIAERHECVISYLDSTNVFAGYAGVMAGVPRVMLSGRSIAPTSFTHIYTEPTVNMYRQSYPHLIDLEGVHLVNNSTEGAKSYADWLGIESKKIDVIPNCVSDDFIQKQSPFLLRLRQEQLGIATNQPFILGVFRMTKEKRAHDFVKIVAQVHKRFPKVRAMICGQGTQKEEIEKLIKALKLEHVLRLGGLVEDVPRVMRCATLLLHTAEIEGSPNVILEAQASGLPIVCAENGGTRQFLAAEWRHYMSKPGKVKEMADSCIALLSDAKGRKKKAEAVRRRALRNSTSSILARNTLKVMGINPVLTIKNKKKV